jgi:organic radical activating enzyme
MFGNNPLRPPTHDDGKELAVKHIFPTLQGEGPNAGHPSVFVRLGGCNLACSFCDTDFEDFQPLSIQSIREKVIVLAQNTEGRRVRHLVVITGGEPFRQPIRPLCEILLEEGFRIQIETNGTLYRPLPEGVEIICSPKNATGRGYVPLRADLLERTTALKFIVSAHQPAYQRVEEVGQTEHQIPVYIQPMDEYDEALNRANEAYALALAEKEGYLLSLQLHKRLGIE